LLDPGSGGERGAIRAFVFRGRPSSKGLGFQGLVLERPYIRGKAFRTLHVCWRAHNLKPAPLQLFKTDKFEDILPKGRLLFMVLTYLPRERRLDYELLGFKRPI
jgi:hypothetical protein